MDVKETLTRWSRAYMEPSLFYVPAKKSSDDEYYNITFHMMVDYFDTVDEKILTNMTIEKLWDKYRENTSDWAHAKYGSIGGNVNTESSFFIAYDIDGNIADCSLWRDAMSFSEIAETEEIDGYVIETYRITKVPHMYYGWNRRVIKNIPNEETIDTLLETYQDYNISLYVLHSGEVYIKVFDRYDTETKKYYYKKQKVGTYSYSNDKFSIDDENVYYDYMIIGNNYKWNNYNGTPTVFGYTSANDYNRTAPMLMLKKGTYTIKQIVSATGCELMEPFTITVDGDKTIYYKINLKGLIQRAELVDCSDGYHKLYDGSDTSGYNDKWTIDGSKSYGSLETINYTYRLSDNKLLVRQRCSNGYSGNNIFIVHGIMGEQNEENRWIACSGKLVRYYLTYGGYLHKDDVASLYDDDTIVSYSYQSILSKQPLNEQELQLMGITKNAYSGIQISTGSAYFYDTRYMIFKVDGWVYNPYETDIGYEEYQNIPTADEIAATINKRSLSEWYITRDEKDEHGSHGLMIKDDGHSRWYVFYSGIAYSIYDYHNLSYPQRLLDKTTGSNRGSQINVVLDYYKSDNIDIENVKKYMTNNIQTYSYNYDGKSTNSVYKNYLTLLSSEVKQDPDWNEEKFNKFQTEMRKKLFEEQLK